MSLSYPCLGVSVSPKRRSCSVAVVVKEQFVRPCPYSYCLTRADGNWALCSRVWEKESVERAVEANWNFGETSRSLTISRACVSTAVQEEVQTKKRSSERAPRVVPAIVAPPHPVLPQPLAPQAFSSQLSPSSRNYWWRI